MIVYRYRLRPPTSGEAAVLDQFRAAHEYRNDLVAIERGRRHARRLVHETDAVREAADALKAATRSTRRASLRALSSARRAADADAPDEIARIEALVTALVSSDKIAISASGSHSTTDHGIASAQFSVSVTAA